MRMHPDQVELDAATVARLVATQFPRWSGLHVEPVASHGTVNALFRLGDRAVLRLPLLPDATAAGRDELVREQDCCRLVAPHVPLDVPEPLAIGEPGAGYPGFWSAYRWIAGTPVDWSGLGDRESFVESLARFVTALHGIDTGGRTWDGGARGGRLSGMDEDVRGALAASSGLVDTGRLIRQWERGLAAPHASADRWIHADLMPGNLVVRAGRLAAVIDLEMVRIGDPAVDLMPAWNLFGPAERETYRRRLGVDDATWERGRAWALAQAIVALPYYVDTNPMMAQTARVTLNALLD